MKKREKHTTKQEPTVPAQAGKHKKTVLFIFLAVFILYGNSIRNNYSIDDFFVTTKNLAVQKGISGIPEIFTSHLVIDDKVNFGYRPIVLVSFAIENEFFGNNPHVSHLINILLYGFTCLLIYFILTRILTGYSQLLPVLITFLFLAHPLHSEVVNNIKSRDELFSFIGALLALHFYLKYTDSKKVVFLFVGMLFLALGILSKLTALVFLAIIPLTLFFFRKINIKNVLLVLGSLVLLLLLLRLFKTNMLEESTVRKMGFTENPLFFEDHLINRIPAGFYSLAFYLRLLLFPHPLSFYYGYDTVKIATWADGVAWFSLLFHVGIFIYALFLLPRKHILAYGILFYLCAISMFANIVKPVVGIVADRFAYVASLGFCIVAAYFLVKIFKAPLDSKNGKTRLSVSLIAVLALIFGLSTIKIISRNKVWKNEITLFRNDVEHYPESAKIHSLITTKLLDEIKEETDPQVKQIYAREAADHATASLNIYSKNSTLFNNLGYLYMDFLNDNKLALENFEKAIQLNPDYADAHYNSARIYEGLKDTLQAIEHYEETISSASDYVKAYSRLGYLYYLTNKVDDALMLYMKGIKVFPNERDFYINIGNIYLYNYGEPKKALDHYEKAYKLNPSDKLLCIDMSKAYAMLGMVEKSADFKKIAENLK